jgi:hypothetical protein
MFRGPKLLKTQCRLNESDMLVERNAILPIDAPIRAQARISLLQLHLPPTHRANSVPVAARQNYARGRVNHVAVEEA